MSSADSLLDPSRFLSRELIGGSSERVCRPAGTVASDRTLGPGEAMATLAPAASQDAGRPGDRKEAREIVANGGREASGRGQNRATSVPIAQEVAGGPDP